MTKYVTDCKVERSLIDANETKNNEMYTHCDKFQANLFFLIYLTAKSSILFLLLNQNRIHKIKGKIC